MKKLTMVLSIILIVMSLLLLIAVPAAGVIGIAIGAFILYKSLKKEKIAAPFAGQIAPANQTEYTFHIAGLPYREKEVAKLLRKNSHYSSPTDTSRRCYKYYRFQDFCVLEPEPTNKHDKNAIKVIIRDTHVGYVPAAECNAVKKFITGKQFTAEAEIHGGTYKEYDGDEWIEENENFFGNVTLKEGR